jgi:hypothetical protein
METRKVNLQEIRSQLVANIYNTLTDKGYDLPEGVDLEEQLGYCPEIMVTGCNSLNYGNDDYTYIFNAKFILFNSEDRFEVWNVNPNEDTCGAYVTNDDFLIEGLAQLEDIVNEIEDE